MGGLVVDNDCAEASSPGEFPFAACEDVLPSVVAPAVVAPGTIVLPKVQYGWPLGMPLIRKLEPGLWEVRSRLRDRTARVIFTVEDDTMVLLHGFIKKSQKTPLQDLQLARQRLHSLSKE